MFFPDRITTISNTDRVLEVGPGGLPHPRSDVFLELEASDEELAAQRGYADEVISDKPTVYYDGSKFPFKDNEFDYVICSHVLEHVDNLELFCRELFRVARRGYIEYPTIYYDYLYNFDVHLNFLKLDNGNLKYMKKSDSPLGFFRPIQDLFYKSLEQQHNELVEGLKNYMFEGFEWQKPFKITRTKQLEELCWPSIESLSRHEPPAVRLSYMQRLKRKAKHLTRGLK